MALLKRVSDDLPKGKRDALRVFPVTVKLTKEERDAVNAFAESRGIARGQWIREVVLAELERASKNSDAALAEIIGVRLLLVNVLRPLAAGKLVSTETFDRFLDQISTAKHELADRITAERKK